MVVYGKWVVYRKRVEYVKRVVYGKWGVFGKRVEYGMSVAFF